MTDEPTEVVETLQGGELVYRAIDPASITVEAHGEAIVIEGRMMPYGEWTEIRSSIEGHFLERFLPGSLSKTIAEQGHRVRALWEHGLDAALGRQAIANVDELREDNDGAAPGAYFRATLLEGLPKLLVSGIRHGLYGSSIRFRPIKMDREKWPSRSEWNPDRLEERSVREAHMKEFSITPFPQYAGATAGIRSITDEVAAKQLLGDPSRLLEMIQTTTTQTEPPHSEPEEPADQAPEPSRSTQPVHDYLRPEEEHQTWRL